MISALIPVYNGPVHLLASELSRQLSGANVEFEILIGDDSDDRARLDENRLANSIPGVDWHQNHPPYGRSKNRNDLAQRARYPSLLFIDGDAAIDNEQYISNYLAALSDGIEVACGGTLYHESPPSDNNSILRWKYGRSREMRSATRRQEDPYRSFSTFQFVIQKSLFERIGFDETLGTYGHEDTLFGLKIMKMGIAIVHLDNGLYHEGLDSGELFLEKTRKAVESLHQLYTDGKIDRTDFTFIRLLNQWVRLKKTGLSPFISLLFRLFSPVLSHKLCSRKPSLLLLDLYKLGYLSSID